MAARCCGQDSARTAKRFGHSTALSLTRDSMATESVRRPSADQGAPASRIETAALWLLIAIIAWAQFPLGSNRPWAWSFLVLLIAVDWALWIPAGLKESAST